MPLGKSLLAACALTLTYTLAPVAGVAVPAATAAPAERSTGPGLHLTAPQRYAGQPVPVTLILVDDEGEPVPGAAIRVERRTDGTWADLAVVTTDQAGTATLETDLTRAPADNTLRASSLDEASGRSVATGPVTLPLRRRNAKASLRGPREVVDEKSVRVAVRWTTGAGEPVAGEVVLERNRNGRWRPETRLTTGEDGRASTRVAPREDARYRLRTPRRPWVQRDTSRVHRVDNLPPGTVVRLPGPAPRRTLPPQPRATQDGPAPRVTAIPDGVWRSMTGRSWHRGCPVGRAGLRLVRVNYWGFDGYRHRGELVAAAPVAGQMAAALAEMYRRALPIRAMYRVDRFGWSRRLQGADDYASMAADNTSAFNCRQVVGRPGVRSPHSYGRSLDINPWENPYRASHGWTPNAWWVGRSHPLVAWRSSAHQVVSIMREHGIRWTYGTADAHHFDAVPGAGERIAARSADGSQHDHVHTAEPVLPKRCRTVVCH